MQRRKLFYCPGCLVQFAIELEPGDMPDEAIADEHQTWLDDITDCPNCGVCLE